MFEGRSYSKYLRVIRNSLIVLFIGGFFIFAYQKRAHIYEKMNELKLIPQPERFTELYFENHTSLPTLVSTNTPLTFSFTFHNLEGEDMVYPYHVYIKDAFGTTTIENTSVMVENNSYKTITENYMLKSVNSQKTLFVELPSKNQKLHFKFQVSITK